MSITLYKVFISILPPDIIHTTFSSFLGKYFPDQIAAVDTAPEPSEVTFDFLVKIAWLELFHLHLQQ